MKKDQIMEQKFSNLVELLQHRAKFQGDKTAYIFLVDGETKEVKLTYGELDKQARAIAATLQKKFAPGERALLLYPPGLEFISGFFGCLYAGIIAVPAYPPDPNKLDVSMAKLQRIIADCTPEVILTTKEFLDLAAFIFPDYPDLEKMEWLASDEVDVALAEDWEEPEINSETLAFLQYTSGSTGEPKGVMVSHGNILYNEEMIKQAFGHTQQTIVVGWLPLFHDMGLIGNTFQPLYLGIPSIFMSPIAFLQKPFRWLQAISHYKATTTGSPNFGCDLCVHKITPEQLKAIDLNSLKVSYNGAEPIYAETLNNFAEAFKSCGLNKNAIYPCYGMAEATLFISGGLKNEPPVIVHIDKTALVQNKIVFCKSEQENAQAIVGCGRTWLEQKILIVEPDTLKECPPDKIGEIWVKGENVAKGYWNNPEQTEKIFKAYLDDTGKGPFLRTEDLGFIKDGELFVTGRIKDLIIIRGRNHYPQDIELTVEKSHEALRSGCCAAFSVDVENEERLVVIQEVKPKGLETLNTDKVIEAIRRAVTEKHELQCYTVVLIEARSIPKTSSGKIQRKLSRTMFLEGNLKLIADRTMDLSVQDALLDNVLPLPTESSKLAIQDWIIASIAQLSGIRPKEVKLDQDFSAYGLDSIKVVNLVSQLEDWLGKPLSPTLIYNYPGILKLSEYLSEEYESGHSALEKTRDSRQIDVQSSNEPIAIVGMSCRFPGADSVENF